MLRLIRGSDSCFYCDHHIDGAAVEWSGHNATILLHPKCVMDLCIRLFRDVHQWQCRRWGNELRDALSRYIFDSDLNGNSNICVLCHRVVAPGGDGHAEDCEVHGLGGGL